MGYIYQIKNKITGKCYIGQTTKLPESRWKQHVNSLTKKGDCPALKDAITKYGIDSFTFCVLIICFNIYNKKSLKTIEDDRVWRNPRLRLLSSIGRAIPL